MWTSGSKPAIGMRAERLGHEPTLPQVENLCCRVSAFGGRRDEDRCSGTAYHSETPAVSREADFPAQIGTSWRGIVSYA
jgi:hypothetical protein